MLRAWGFWKGWAEKGDRMWPWNWASLKNTDSRLAPLQGHQFQLEHLCHPFPQSHASPSHSVFSELPQATVGDSGEQTQPGRYAQPSELLYGPIRPATPSLVPRACAWGQAGLGAWMGNKAKGSHMGNKGNEHGLTPESATSLLCNFGRAWWVVWASVFSTGDGDRLWGPL